jgi:hypothetical protein
MASWNRNHDVVRRYDALGRHRFAIVRPFVEDELVALFWQIGVVRKSYSRRETTRRGSYQDVAARNATPRVVHMLLPDFCRGRGGAPSQLVNRRNKMADQGHHLRLRPPMIL